MKLEYATCRETGRRCRASGTSGAATAGAADMQEAQRRCLTLAVADRGTRDRIGGRGRSRLGDRGAGEKSLQNHEPCRDQNDRAAAMRGKSGWHANLSHATLAHLIFGNLRIGGA